MVLRTLKLNCLYLWPKDIKFVALFPENIVRNKRLAP